VPTKWRAFSESFDAVNVVHMERHAAKNTDTNTPDCFVSASRRHVVENNQSVPRLARRVVKTTKSVIVMLCDYIYNAT